MLCFSLVLDNLCTLETHFVMVFDKMVIKKHIVSYSTDLIMRVIILLKQEKVKEGIHQGGKGLGLITGIVFCLHIDGNICWGASDIWGLMCQSTLNWAFTL